MAEKKKWSEKMKSVATWKTNNLFFSLNINLTKLKRFNVFNSYGNCTKSKKKLFFCWIWFNLLVMRMAYVHLITSFQEMKFELKRKKKTGKMSISMKKKIVMNNLGLLSDMVNQSFIVVCSLHRQKFNLIIQVVE